jgi:hypothetical protein
MQEVLIEIVLCYDLFSFNAVVLLYYIQYVLEA